MIVAAKPASTSGLKVYGAACRRQRGAIGMFGALVFLLAILLTALSIDTARLNLEKRRLQNIADLAALQAMKVAGLCSGVETIDINAIKAAAQASATADGYKGDLTTEQDAVLLGTAAADATGNRQFTSTVAADADSVQVTATTAVLKSLVAGGWFAGTVPLKAVGVARRQPWAEFSLGSFLASVNPGDVAVLNQLFGGLLGSSLNLQLVSYQGLAAAQVSMADLVASASAGSVQGLLDTQVTVAGLITIMLNAVDSSSAAYQALNDVLAVAGANANTFRIGDLIQVTATDPAAVTGASINVANLLSAALQLANRQHAISMPVALTLPAGFGTANLSLYVIEPAVIAIGPPGKDSNGNWRTHASTAQVRFAIDVALNAPLGAVTVTGQLNMYGSAATASGALDTMRCASMADLGDVVTVDVTTGILELGLGSYANNIDDPAPVPVINPSPALTVDALGTTIATVDVAADPQLAPGQSQSAVFTVDASHPLPQTVTVGSDVGSALTNALQTLTSTLQVNVNVVPLAVGVPPTLAQDVNQTLLTPAISAIGSGLLAPLFQALGINLGGADVQLLDMNREDFPQLVI